MRVTSITIKAATTAYTFTVTPSVATHYNVRLFANATATAPVVSSPVANLYVATDQAVSAPQKCARPVCHETFRIDAYVPASALSTEMRNYAYSYFGINLGSTSIPRRRPGCIATPLTARSPVPAGYRQPSSRTR